jgi:hypothetical protein
MRRKYVVLSLCMSVAAAVFVRSARSGPAPTNWEKARSDSAQKAYTLYRAQLDSGLSKPEQVYLWSMRWADAEGAKVAAVDAHLDRMKSLEGAVDKAVKAGLMYSADLSAASFYRAEAELWSARAHGAK